MVALWTVPGKLTKEYWEGKRARHIPPVSLYIFISAAFFIISTLVPDSKENIVIAANGNVQKQETDSAQEARLSVALDTLKSRTGYARFIAEKLKQINKIPPEKQQELGERFEHYFPKIFFCMIPFMALLLQGAFARRKGACFVNHAISPCMRILSFSAFSCCIRSTR